MNEEDLPITIARFSPVLALEVSPNHIRQGVQLVDGPDAIGALPGGVIKSAGHWVIFLWNALSFAACVSAFGYARGYSARFAAKICGAVAFLSTA